MCKCKMFADRFNVPLYSGILINDRSVENTEIFHDLAGEKTL